jgi:hypothetical protein
MNELSTAASNILNSIEPALTKLSETFCVSVDYLKLNAMEYILRYGRYELMVNIFIDILWMLGISAVIIGFAVLIGRLIYDEYNNYDDTSFDWKKIIKISSIIMGSFILLIVVFQVITYVSSPEIYSIKQVLKLIRMIQ